MGVAGKREIENDPSTFGLSNWGDGGSTHRVGDHCHGSKAGGGKSRVLFYGYFCWTAKWRCRVGKRMEGARRKGQVLAVNIRVTSNS